MPKGIYERKKRSPICKRGHDTSVVGRGKIGDCCECRILKNQNFGWYRVGIVNQDGTPFTVIDYDRAYQVQQGRCANVSCNKHQSEIKRRFDVDHDHTTGQFRGLLCINCNTALGFSCDNSDVLRGLGDYLDKSNG